MEPVVFAAEQFGFHQPFFEELTEGLIHKTYKVTAPDKIAILQQVNTQIFKDPDQIIQNYLLLYTHLKNSPLKIPAPLKTTQNKNIWIDPDNSCWRGFEFVSHTYTETLPAAVDKIFSAAKCYGEFTRALSGIEINALSETITGFHDLNSRYRQLQKAIKKATTERLNVSKELLIKIEQRKALVNFYDSLKSNPEFKLRVMHHDCKLSNILFNHSSGLAVCPIDLDTAMSGYFFSDVGDMLRSMISDKDENAAADSVRIDPLIYQAIIAGYQSGMGNSFTETEKKYIHHSGMLMLYMQGIRFLEDFLSHDRYFKIRYSEQNFNRALNQLTLLEKLEGFLEKEYYHTIK